MSSQKINDEATRWFSTAEEDIAVAKLLRDNKKYSHACFTSQQAAEKAVKALYFSNDLDPWGHSIKKLISTLDALKFEKLKLMEPDAAKLDRFYIPTRYPNGLPGLTPSEAYSEVDAQEAITIAENIIEFVRGMIK